LIVKDADVEPRERRLAVRQALRSLPTTISVEPLVVTDAEVNGRLALGDPFFDDSTSRGKTVYESAKKTFRENAAGRARHSGLPQASK
jgi:hypothetical protein